MIKSDYCISNTEIVKGINIDDNNKRYLSYQIKWFGIYIGVGLFLSILLPFPISFFVYLPVFLIINFVRTRLRLKKMGISMKSLFKQSSSILDSSRHSITDMILLYELRKGTQRDSLSQVRFKDEKDRMSI